jgi:hypothetical protein
MLKFEFKPKMNLETKKCKNTNILEININKKINNKRKLVEELISYFKIKII